MKGGLSRRSLHKFQLRARYQSCFSALVVEICCTAGLRALAHGLATGANVCWRGMAKAWDSGGGTKHAL